MMRTRTAHARIKLRCGCYLALPDDIAPSTFRPDWLDQSVNCATHGLQPIVRLEGQMRGLLPIDPAA